ncbi:hypothetical protein IT157_01665 [bacterium]|jgi:hypothetical protein|nr:hypothetical protein [bacterium]
MIFLLYLLFPLALFAAPSPLVQESDSLFHAGDYEKVELLALRAEQDTLSLSVEDRIALHLNGAYSLIMLSREDDARRQYEKALLLNSDLVLDPVLVSPKFRGLFEDVKLGMQREQIAEPKRGVVTRGARPLSLALNLFVPGVGHLQEGRTLRGVGYLALEAAMVGAWIYYAGEASDSRAAYLAEQDRTRVPGLYDEYDSDYRVMRAAASTAGAVYLLSQIDLVLYRKQDVAITVLPMPQGARLGIRF